MGPIQNIEDVLGLIRRRFWIMLLVVIVGVIISVYVAKSQPKAYSAIAALQVEMPLVAESGQAAAAPLSAIQRLSAIQHRLTTRENLLSLSERHHAFEPDSPLSDDERVSIMRKSLSFETVSNEARQMTALLITARGSTAQIAADMANDIARSILDMGAAENRSSTEASFSFFKEQEARLWDQITKLEAEIAAYREDNRAALPGFNEARQTEISAIETNLRSYAAEQAALDTEKRQIDGLQVKRATDKRRLEDIRQRLDLITAQTAPLIQRKAELDASIFDTAEVERVISSYDRQRSQLQEQYTLVSARMAEAETAQDLASRQQTERFSMLEQAVPPVYPENSGARKIALAGLIASCGAACIIAFLLELRKPVLRTSSRLERELDIKPLMAIPSAPLERKARKLLKSGQSRKISSLAHYDRL